MMRPLCYTPAKIALFLSFIKQELFKEKPNGEILKQSLSRSVLTPSSAWVLV